MRCSLVALLVLSVAGSAAAQGIPAKPRMTQDSANLVSLTRLEELWSNAIMRRDRAMFERTLAQKFLYVTSDSLVERTDYISRLLQPADLILDARTDSVQVNVFGNTGIVTGYRTFAGRAGPVGFERRIRFMDVWQPRSGSWQMISAMDYPVPKR